MIENNYSFRDYKTILGDKVLLDDICFVLGKILKVHDNLNVIPKAGKYTLDGLVYLQYPDKYCLCTPYGYFEINAEWQDWQVANYGTSVAKGLVKDGIYIHEVCAVKTRNIPLRYETSLKTNLLSLLTNPVLDSLANNFVIVNKPKSRNDLIHNLLIAIWNKGINSTVTDSILKKE